jgi:hypothetical protein
MDVEPELNSYQKIGDGIYGFNADLIKFMEDITKFL